MTASEGNWGEKNFRGEVRVRINRRDMKERDNKIYEGGLS